MIEGLSQINILKQFKGSFFLAIKPPRTGSWVDLDHEIAEIGRKIEKTILAFSNFKDQTPNPFEAQHIIV